MEMMNSMKITHIIKCPKCGQEYLPSEIYIPSEFIGKPLNIVKDEKGNIMYYSGDNMNLEEEYICDKCGCKFKVNANVSFTTKEIKEEVFDDEYTTIIYKDRVELKEPK